MSLTLLKPFNLDTTLDYTFGNITGSNTSISNATITGNASISANLTVSGKSNLGPAGNLIITGGTSGYVLTTDGAGNISWAAATATSAQGVSNGTSNISIPVSSGNINLSAAGNANILIITGTGVNVTSTLSVTGNANVGNLGTAGLILATGNITGANLFATTKVTSSQLVSNVATGTPPFIVTSTTQVANLNVATAGTVTTAAQSNITSLGTLTSLSVTGNIAAGNVDAGNLLTASYVAGTLTTASQPNITSHGTLTGLTSGGTVNFTTASNVTLGSVGNLHISGGSSGQYLQTDGSGGLTWAAAAGGGGGSSTLTSLTDVNVTTPTNGQALVYDTASSKWINGTVSGGGGGSLTITDDTSTDSTYYPVYATASSGSMSIAGISTTKMQFNPSSGQLTVQDLNTLSDATLKENAIQISDPFEVLSQIFGMGFNWKDTGKKSYGVMAQMLEKVLPELVSVNAQGKKTVNYIPIIAFLVEAVNKQQQDINLLKKDK